MVCISVHVNTDETCCSASVGKHHFNKSLVLFLISFLVRHIFGSSLFSGTSSVASKYEELECLYAAVGKVIYEGLTNYEKATSANPTQLFGKRCLS